MKRPYLILTGLFSFVFAYLLLTEVYARYDQTLWTYRDISAREARDLDPASLRQRLKLLTLERDSLSRKLLTARRGYEQNQIGVIQCVTDNAHRCNVTVKAFSPGKEATIGQSKEFDFSILVVSRFGQVGSLIDGLEKETIPFDIRTVEITSDPIGEATLKTTIQATASLYEGYY